MEAASTAVPAHSPSVPMPRTIGAPTPQHMQALEHANEIRLARAELKRRVKAGTASVPEVFRANPGEVETMTVSELLRSQKRWGRTRARKFLTPFSINENRTIGKLTDRQRNELAERLETV
jgi:hypothetical protein